MSGKKKSPTRDVRIERWFRFARLLISGRPIPRFLDPSPRYTDKLAKPLPALSIFARPFEGSLPPFRGYEDIGAHIDNEMSSRFLLLLDHFGIPKDLSESDRWFFLTFALARNHVPGLRFGKTERRGLKLEWNYRRELRLYATVMLRVLDGLTLAEACQRVAATAEYRPMKAESLRVTFQRIKRENPSARTWDMCPPEDYPGFKDFLSVVMKKT